MRIDAPIIAETSFNYMDAKNGFGFNLAIHGNYDDPAGTPLQSAISISAAQLASANSEVEALAMIGELLDAHCRIQDMRMPWMYYLPKMVGLPYAITHG